MLLLGVEARDEVVAASQSLLPQPLRAILLALPSPSNEDALLALGEQVAAQPPSFDAHDREVAPRLIMVPQMIPTKDCHEVPDPFSSFRVIAPGVVVDPLGASKHSVSQAFRRFDSFRPDGPRRKPFLQVITHQKVADLVPLFHLFLSILLPVVEPPPPLHI
jgi:hypothetical protein